MEKGEGATMSDTPTTPAVPRADREAAKKRALDHLKYCADAGFPNCRCPTCESSRDYLTALAELAEARAENQKLKLALARRVATSHQSSNAVDSYGNIDHGIGRKR